MEKKGLTIKIMTFCAYIVSFGTGLYALVVLAFELFFFTQIYSVLLNARFVKPGAVSGLFFLSPCQN